MLHDQTSYDGASACGPVCFDEGLTATGASLVRDDSSKAVEPLLFPRAASTSFSDRENGGVGNNAEGAPCLCLCLWAKTLKRPPRIISIAAWKKKPTRHPVALPLVLSLSIVPPCEAAEEAEPSDSCQFKKQRDVPSCHKVDRPYI